MDLVVNVLLSVYRRGSREGLSKRKGYVHSDARHKNRGAVQLESSSGINLLKGKAKGVVLVNLLFSAAQHDEEFRLQLQER